MTANAPVTPRTPIAHIHVWTEEEINAFETRWPRGTIQRTAFDLMLHAAIRPHDARHLLWANIHDNGITLRQRKTGHRLTVGVPPDLARSLSQEAVNKGAYVLSDARGQPYSSTGFHQFMRRAFEAARLPKHCSPYGLRKAAVRRMLEAGFDIDQIRHPRTRL